MKILIFSLMVFSFSIARAEKIRCSTPDFENGSYYYGIDLSPSEDGSSADMHITFYSAAYTQERIHLKIKADSKATDDILYTQELAKFSMELHFEHTVTEGTLAYGTMNMPEYSDDFKNVEVRCRSTEDSLGHAKNKTEEGN
jgi:hypothetical protein